MDLVAGIDIGGTKTKLGLVNQSGACLLDMNFRTREYPDLEDFLDKTIQCVHELIEQCSTPVNLLGIGIGAPNASNTRGTIEYAPNLYWKGIVPLLDKLKQRMDVAMKVTNDANAAALGEMQFGNAKGMKDFIVITLGTGLGSGIVANGNIVYGFDGFAGEFGHFAMMPEDGRVDGLGVRGGLEAYVSATGLKRTIMHLISKYPHESRFRGVAFNDLHGEEITEAAEQNDPIALMAFEYTGKILGKALANFTLFSQPEAYFLAGGLANCGKWIFDPTQKYMDQHLLQMYKGKVKILPSGMTAKNAAISGAAALIWGER
ncbi:MAG: glucokinase [Cyclobacteriaceae bacterium]|nr:MAG: glucokinase [Cyclobacteriaceae bacterium]